MPIETFTAVEDLSPGDSVTLTTGGVRRAKPGELLLGVAVKAENDTVAVYTSYWPSATRTPRQQSLFKKSLSQFTKAQRLLDLCLNNPYAIEIEEARPFRPAPTDLEL